MTALANDSNSHASASDSRAVATTLAPRQGGDGIAVLAPEVANLIAAGEVIERPASLLRELVDNAIDAGARQIDVRWDDGGRALLAVADDGSGMSEEDVRSCALRHATSKVRSAADLYRVATLGFRGEALASIAACAELEVLTRPAAARVGWRLAASGTTRTLVPHACAAGTRVTVERLFAKLPARRRFLKSSRAETTMCKRTLLEKALAHPQIGFTSSVDGRVALTLAATPLMDRVQAALPALADGALHAAATHGSVAVEMVAGRPEVARRDRSGIMVFVNGRRIQDYALLQAVEYGYSSVLPGGLHPVACVFLDVAADAVDFNVHPAKREARFRDPAALHQAVVRTTGQLLLERATLRQAPPDGDERTTPARSFPGGAELLPARAGRPAAIGAGIRGRRESGRAAPSSGPESPLQPLASGFNMPEPPAADQRLKLLGQVLGTFIAVETEAGIYFVDQHAAHERVLFDELEAGGERGAAERGRELQPVLLPIEVELPRPADGDRGWLAELESSGIRLEVAAPDRREARVVALAPMLHTLPAAAIVDMVGGLSGGTDELARAALADVACKLAIKAGEVLTDDDALRIAARSFQLGVQHCPHGRPVWFLLSRAEAFAAVGRE